MRLVDDYTHYHFYLWKKGGVITHFDMMFLSFEFLIQDYDYILCLKFDPPLDIFKADIHKLTKSLECILLKDPTTFIILTQRRKAPIIDVRYDEIIYSFSVDFQLFKKMIKNQSHLNLPSKNLLFEFLDCSAKDTVACNKFIVLQIPFAPEKSHCKKVCDVIIPYKGNFSYLQNLMNLLKSIKNINVFTGIDQLLSKTKFTFAAPNFHFYFFKPNPLGPYVIRNWLVGQGKSPIIAFQDSDDIPCANRFERLIQYMQTNNIPLCGSHEISMDYFNRTVQAVRYPLNVISALKNGSVHAMLHPSTAMLRDTFYTCNTLSENRIFANDTKFLYYCYFKVSNIHNIDDFLYIRRLHPGSLTTAPETCIGSPLRTYLKNRWVVDFTLVKLGLLKLEDSCLNFEGTKRKYKVKKI